MTSFASSSAAPALKSLQILRAIAAISVVYHHVGAMPHFGSFGVDIFFVMSGFFMTMVLARKQDQRRTARCARCSRLAGP